MKKLGKFLLGGSAYVALELLWRGRSHISMFAAGGVCFMLLGKLRSIRLPLSARSVMGAAGVTGVELVAGLLFNRSFQVWDYRNMPLNFLGQICLPFSLLWIPVSALGMGIHALLERDLTSTRRQVSRQ